MSTRVSQINHADQLVSSTVVDSGAFRPLSGFFQGQRDWIIGVNKLEPIMFLIPEDGRIEIGVAE